MPNRLDPLNLMDFTGGLNLRRNQFQLADNESPDMLNVDVDPRGGFRTRRGWQRWNETDVITPTEALAWAPRNAAIHVRADGTETVYVVNNGNVYAAGPDGIFTHLSAIDAEATFHGADFAPWGDDMFIVGGRNEPTYRRSATGTLTAMSPDAWSEVDAPTSGTVPQAELVEAHASYLFVAVMNEDGEPRRSRLRWSHPNKPDAFREDDFLDIEQGGGTITGLLSFRDHLLIFKTNSMWALYGYDDDSWQLIKVSISVGCPNVVATTRSESAVFFYSASDRGGIYVYTGDAPQYISEKLRPVFEEILSYQNVFVSWAGRRLWVSAPWVKGIGSTTEVSTCFVFDSDVGDGAWTMYRSEYGAIGPVIDGADVNAKYPLAAFWSPYSGIMVTLDYVEDAYDIITEPPSLGASPPPQPDSDYLVTSLDEEIGITGESQIGQRFDSYYRTRWLHAGWPDRKKSWRRPTFICREVARDIDLLVETYRDYDESTVHRSRTLKLRAEGSAYWTEGGFADADIGGFDWKELGKDSPDGRGADWGAQRAGSKMMRAGSMGLARSVQMRVRASPNTQLRGWGVDGIVAKFVQRRFR